MLIRLLTFCFLSLLLSPLSAQNCTPDDTYRDSAFAIVPLPRSMDNPDGGIDKPACLNENYEFVFTFKIPLTLNYLGNDIPIDSIVLDTEDPTTIAGLPNGIDYSCNPPDCNFDPSVDSLVCVVLNGIPDDTPKDYPLTIKMQVYNPVFGLVNLPFPNTFIDGFQGDYTIELREEGNCQPATSVTDLSNEFDIAIQPNPFAYTSLIQIDAPRDEVMDLTVVDLYGKVVFSQNVQLWRGQNNVEFDGSNLANGLYYMNLYNNRGQLSRKLFIQR